MLATAGRALTADADVDVDVEDDFELELVNEELEDFELVSFVLDDDELDELDVVEATNP